MKPIGFTPPPIEPLSYDQLALIMKGGGVKGLAYVGALEILQKYYQFDWFTGTSAVAIAAILLGSEHSIMELNDILSHKKFSDFKDANFFQRFLNLIFKGGLYKADSFVDWMDKILATKLDSTTAVRLEDLPKRTTAFASRKDKSALIFDSIDTKSKTKYASYAARCCMSIPFIFTPQSSEGLRVFDGGAQNNFPVEGLLKFQPNTNFIGLYLRSETYKSERKNIFGDLMSIWTESSDPDILRKYKNKIVVIDPSPISTFKFTLSTEEKEFLLEAGRLGALKFLGKRSDFNIEEYDYTKRKTQLEAIRIKLIKKRNNKILLLKILFILLILISFLYLILIIKK